MDVEKRQFGDHLRQLRSARRLTQEALAEKSGLAVDSVRRIELGRFSPSLETLRKLSGGLGLSVAGLFNGYDGPGKDNRPAEDLCDILRHQTPERLEMIRRVVDALLLDRGRN